MRRKAPPPTSVTVQIVSKLTRNIAYNLGGQLTLVAVSFVAARYIFGGLGRDVLGLIYFAQTLNAIIIAVVEVGIGATIVKEISASEHDRPYVELVVRSGAAFAWIAYAGFAIALVGAAPWIVDHWIALEHLDRATAISVLRILGASTLLTIPQVFYGSVFRGLQAMGPPNAVDVGALVVQQLGTALLISTGHGIEAVAWWIAGTYVCRVAILITMVAGIFSWRCIVPVVDATAFRRSKRAAQYMLAISALTIVHTQSDKLIITSTLPIASIGIYGLLFSAVGRGGILSAAVAQGALPVFSTLAATGQREELTRQYQRLQTLLCFGMVPFYALIALGSRLLFGTIFGSETAATLIAPAYLLALGFYLNSTLSVPYFFTLADNRPDLAMRFGLLALCVTLPVTFLLTWQLGFVGAGIAWIWYQVFVYVWFIPRACRACLGIGVTRAYRDVGEPLALAAATYGVAALLLHVFALHSLAMFLVSYGVASLLFLAATWWRIGPALRGEAIRFVRAC